MYASIRRCRHMYGNYVILVQTWTHVIVNRSIGKILTTDPRLVASQVYIFAVTWTQSCIDVTHIQSTTLCWTSNSYCHLTSLYI